MFARTLLPLCALALATLPVLGTGTAQNYCLTSPNSVGPGAIIHWTGPVTLRDGALVVDGLPPHASVLFAYGLAQQQTPFGNGYSCIGGSNWILARKLAKADGTVVLDIAREGEAEDLDWIQYLGLDRTWNFQCWYRDLGSGGLQTNLSDALHVQF
jgi:hypothetical protein